MASAMPRNGTPSSAAQCSRDPAGADSRASLERELLKRASLASAMADALRQRGVTEPTASLAAEAGVIAFKTAYARWVGDPDEQDLPTLIRGGHSTSSRC